MQEENKMEETNGEFSQKKLQIQQQQLQQVQQQQQTNLNSPNTLNEYYGLILGNKYRIENKIGSGSFGEIYHAINLRTNEDVAVKIEKKSQHRKKQENSINPEQGVNSFYQENRHSQVKREAKIYSMLHGERKLLFHFILFVS
jgi:serine/threonine protein kinase